MKILCWAALCIFSFIYANGQSLKLSEQASVQQQAAQNLADKELERLQSADVETRRDAAHNLRLQQNAIAARVAVTALNDKSEIVRATACAAVAYAADEDAARFLTPLLAKKEKSEFVRREAAFALGNAQSKTAVPALIEVLQTDKKPSVRAAVAISLGKISDTRAITALSDILLLSDTKKNRRTVDEFVRRSAARALGEIRHKQAVPSLITALGNSANTDDIRREIAFALGLIADRSATEILRANLNSSDYLLAEIAKNALQRIQRAEDNNGQYPK